jgi:hypothetical protein
MIKAYIYNVGEPSKYVNQEIEGFDVNIPLRNVTHL